MFGSGVLKKQASKEMFAYMRGNIFTLVQQESNALPGTVCVKLVFVYHLTANKKGNNG